MKIFAEQGQHFPRTKNFRPDGRRVVIDIEADGGRRCRKALAMKSTGCVYHSAPAC